MGILSDRVVLITGSGSGLGKATAIAFAQEGAKIVLCGRRASKIEEVQRSITELGGTALAVTTDISSETDVQRLFAAVAAEFGKLDILINNAAVFEPGNVLETTLQSWNYHLQNNLTGAFLVTQAALPLMRKQNYGRIVNITSGLAHNAAGGFAAYGVSKAGLEALTRTVADEEGAHNILANLYNPGAIKTNMHATGKDPRTAIPELLKLVTLPRNGMNGKLVEAGA